MRCGGVNELLGIALPLILTSSKSVTITIKFGKLYFLDHGNNSALLEEILVVPAVHIEGGG